MITRSVASGLDWYASRRRRRLESLWQRPADVQEIALRSLLWSAADTEFGLAHGFRSIRTVAQYQERVPAPREEREARIGQERVEAMGHLGRRDAILRSPHEQRRSGDLGEPLFDVVPLGRARKAEDAKGRRGGGDHAPDGFHPLRRDKLRIEDDLLHLLPHVGLRRTMRHAAGEASLEEPGGAGEDEAGDAVGMREGQLQRDVAA